MLKRALPLENLKVSGKLLNGHYDQDRGQRGQRRQWLPWPWLQWPACNSRPGPNFIELLKHQQDAKHNKVMLINLIMVRLGRCGRPPGS